MARTVNSLLRPNVMGDESGEAKIFLVTITHESLPNPIRVSSHALQRISADDEKVYYGVVSRGTTWEYAGFDCALANDEAGTAPSVVVSIPNASRDIITAIESMGASPAIVKIELILSDYPNDVVLTLDNYEMTDITYDDATISGTISRDLMFNEPFPCHTFNNLEWQGLGW